MTIYLVEIMAFGLVVFLVGVFVDKRRLQRGSGKEQLILAFHQQIDAARKDVAAALESADALAGYKPGRSGR